MLVVVAPDSFKGSLSAMEAANAMRDGVWQVFPEAKVVCLPVADGGEGTAEVLVAATGGHWQSCRVQGPLGALVEARWGLLGDAKTAVFEMASASGLLHLANHERNPSLTSTYGTGELIRAVLDHQPKAERLLIGIGGSASNDGGCGMAQALGVRFYDEQGCELPQGGAALARLAFIDVQGLDPRLADLELVVACDVVNPLTGPNGASVVYGPQKGADKATVVRLDTALARYACIASKTTGRQVADVAGAGAAGGLGAGFLYFTHARLCKGIDVVLDALGFDKIVRSAQLVITGEGLTDRQTAMGKAPLGVAAAAKKWGVPVVCVSGGLGEGAAEVLAHGVDAMMSMVPRPLSLQECMEQAAMLTTDATARACRLLKLGASLR